MSVHGDIAASLKSQLGYNWPEGNEILKVVLQCADDPNFAYAYARLEPADDQNSRMLAYWDVVRFLKETAGVK